jgi:phosphoribosyl-AMP cyclohydrolase
MNLIDFSKGKGLVPAIVQDAESGDVLMLGYMNDAALKKTVETGRACFYSRSRQKLWVKGETSGHIQKVREIFVDCDRDTILLKVEQVGGAACHTGYRSCFFQRLEDAELKVVGERVFDPKEVYGE